MKEITGNNLILLDIVCKSREEVIKILANKLNQDGRIDNIESYIHEVLHREEIYSTAVGFNVAIPHGKCEAVNTTSIAFARLSSEIPWGDEENVSIIFLLAVPSSEAGNKHLDIMASLSRRLIHEEYRKKIRIAQRPEDIVCLIDMD